MLRHNLILNTAISGIPDVPKYIGNKSIVLKLVPNVILIYAAATFSHR